MKQAGMPIATDVSIIYTEVEPQRRLGYTSLATSSRARSPMRWRQP